MRELPEHVQQQAYDTFLATKNCNLADTSQVRSRGVLLVPRVMESADLEPNEVYLKELMANASEGTQGVKRFHGRSTFRGGKMNSAHLIDEVNPRLLDKLDRMLGEWNKKGYTPLLPWLESENATAPRTNMPLQVREIEHVVINPDEHDCHTAQQMGSHAAATGMSMAALKAIRFGCQCQRSNCQTRERRRMCSSCRWTMHSFASSPAVSTPQQQRLTVVAMRLQHALKKSTCGVSGTTQSLVPLASGSSRRWPT